MPSEQHDAATQHKAQCPAKRGAFNEQWEEWMCEICGHRFMEHGPGAKHLTDEHPVDLSDRGKQELLSRVVVRRV